MHRGKMRQPMLLRDYFDQLTLKTIENFVLSRQEEHVSLDFKTVSDAELKKEGDKKHLAESISGFANSAGGLVIWGVGTEKVAGQDVASKAVPIPNVRHFVTRLDDVTPFVVSPTLDGVTHRAFERSDGSGFAATFVPESDAGPHMALLGHDRFFKRAGDRFYRMAQFDVADMFGRRQRPLLSLDYVLQFGASQWRDVTRHEIHILLSVTNAGRASAVAPYVRLEVPKIFNIGALGISSIDRAAPLQLVSEAARPRVSSLIGKSDLLIHPKVSFQIAQLSVALRADEPVPGCHVQYATAALNAPLSEGEIIIAASEIASVANRTVEAYEK
jgi:hypothetical protein